MYNKTKKDYFFAGVEMKKMSKKSIAATVFIIIIVVAIYLLSYEFVSIGIFGYFLSKIKGVMITVFTAYTVLVGVVIFFESKDPAKTMAWLLVLVVLPFVGFVFYIMFGQSYRRKKIFSKKKRIGSKHLENTVNLQKEMIEDYPMTGELDSPVNQKLARLLLNNSDAVFTVNNSTEIYSNGRETYSAIIRALRNAEKQIHLEYFIIKDDKIGNIIRKILIEKASEGLEVRLIYDSVGCWRLSKNYLESLKKSGAEVMEFFPVIFPVLSRELNYRNHRKIVVVDGKVGFVGGMNIGDEYLGNDPRLGYWSDTHMRIEGEGVYLLQNIFLKDWEFVSGQYLEGIDYYPKIDYRGNELLQISSSGPDSDWESIQQAYFTMITAAKSRIWIMTPYLVPDKSLGVALKTAALSGLDVRIIMPSKPDHFTVYWASRGNVEDLLEAGVKIYTYEKGFMHSKVFIVDDTVASVGTANLDIRSLEINFEVNAFIYDRKTVKKLERDFQGDIGESKEIQLEEHRKRGLGVKFLEAYGRLLSPLL